MRARGHEILLTQQTGRNARQHTQKTPPDDDMGAEHNHCESSPLDSHGYRSLSVLMDDSDNRSEACTLGILRELREMAEEIGRGHTGYANRFHELLQKVANPNLPEVAREMGFRVIALEPGTSNQRR